MQQTYKYPCQSVISKKLHSNFIEIALWHGYSPVNLMHIFRTTFLKNSTGGVFWIFSLLLAIVNLRQTSIRIWMSVKPTFWLCRMNLCSTDKRFTIWEALGCLILLWDIDINNLLHNVPKWSDTLYRHTFSCEFCAISKNLFSRVPPGDCFWKWVGI